MVFFSGTDMQCLHDNAPIHDMFLSVIINNKGHKIAKLAIVAKVEQSVSFNLMKKLFRFDTPIEEYLAIFDCNVEIEGSNKFVEEFNRVKTESKKRHQIKHAPLALKENISLPQYIGEQGELFNDYPEFEAEETLELSDLNIESLLVRAISIDELESRSLKDVIIETKEELPEGDQNDYVEMMIDHYEYILRSEFSMEQFDTVINRSKHYLNDYRNWRFVSQFIYKLENLLQYYNGSIGDINRDITADREEIAYPKTKAKNEF